MKGANANDLVRSIESLKKDSVGKTVNQRIKEFQAFRNASADDLFSELCFCIMTANCSAESCINVQKEIGPGFLVLSEKQLASKLKKVGYRFPNKRAAYIVLAREKKDELIEIIKTEKEGKIIRECIFKNIKGLGMKEASHFLRNIGFGDVAIIDFHIVDILVENGIIEKPKTLTKKIYLEIEEKLEEIAQKTKLNLGELDLFLWYAETGKILK